MPFYLIPIILASALVSRSAGAWMSVVCATVWFLVDVGAGSIDYWHAISPYWNALVRLFFFLMVVGVISLNKSLQKEKSRARVDLLTGILNRRAFYELSRQEMARSRRYHRPLSLVFFDLNGFKQVNDRYGHRTGDKILRCVGASIRKNIREGDIAARWGGDEFAVLLPETEYKGAMRFVNRLNKALVHIAEQEVKGVKASFGIKTYAVAPVSVDEMVKAADELMYSAKRAGLLHKEQVFRQGNQEVNYGGDIITRES
ncbi:MAG: GGDEF domain-containing protein [Candidatus Omnitrophica bacterium]|nr:GGDEF domain-containing protein [Candidatus Omnitrophota bacterium]